MKTDEIIRKLRYYAEAGAAYREVNPEETKQLLTEAADRLEELDERVAIMSEGGWISVKDRPPRMPEVSERCEKSLKQTPSILVYTANGCIHQTYGVITITTENETLYFDDTCSECFWQKLAGKKPKFDMMIKGNEITHWMVPELPEYKEE